MLDQFSRLMSCNYTQRPYLVINIVFFFGGGHSLFVRHAYFLTPFRPFCRTIIRRNSLLLQCTSVSAKKDTGESVAHFLACEHFPVSFIMIEIKS